MPLAPRPRPRRSGRTLPEGSPAGARERFTFRGNLRQSRHGWLRLTPAYSLHLVRELLDARSRPDLPVLDPFAGTGTTLLACAERGIDCHSVDVNPFLRWLAAAKVARYSARDRAAAGAIAARVAATARDHPRDPSWLPPIHRRDRWWVPGRAHALGRAFDQLRAEPGPERALDLVRLALCRALIQTANVSFGHQSMSFAAPAQRETARAGAAAVAAAIEEALAALLPAAALALPRATLRTHLDDARTLTALARERFGMVVTSPPYANRMSYVRELRPYLYWLGYLVDPRDAGELDWRAIGGTWGVATSRLARWIPPAERDVPASGLPSCLADIAARSDLLSRYVHRYFHDLTAHVGALFPRVAPGGSVHYVVGNSAFYDVIVPTQDLLAAILLDAGFAAPRVRQLRARTSKRGLFEYVVSAERP